MSLKLRWSLCALGATMLAGPLVAQDLTLIFKETGASGQKTSTQYFTKDRLRHNFADHDTIFEYATGKITNIDHKKKEYSEITLAEMEAAAPPIIFSIFSRTAGGMFSICCFICPVAFSISALAAFIWASMSARVISEYSFFL